MRDPNIPPDADHFAPGLYHKDGSVYVDVPEALRHHGLPVTPENQAILLSVVQKNAPGIPTEIVQKSKKR